MARARKIDGFLLGLAAVIVLAWLWPGPGMTGGAMHPEILTKVGVALVFFLHGASLSFASLRAGALEWPLHLSIQSITFVLFPLLGALLFLLLPTSTPTELALGFAFLCALPSTVSSSVALTATAGGEVSVAIFNASLSSLLGVVLTPLWVEILSGQSASGRPFGAVLLDLTLWLLLPLVLGQLSRRFLGAALNKRQHLVHRFDRFVILLLVYTAFADSVARGIWRTSGAATLAWTLACSVGLLGLVLLFVHFACTARRVPHAARAAILFCGSTKSLASGVPMAQIIFGGAPGLGLILLPILVYHPLQLVVCGALASQLGRAAGDVPPV